MVVGRNNGVVGLTGFSDKKMSGLLFGPQKSGRNNGVVVLTGWSYGGVPLYGKSFQAFYAAGCWGLLAVGASSFLYNMSHDWKKYKQSQL